MAPRKPSRDLPEQVRSGAPALRVCPVAIGEDEDVQRSLQPVAAYRATRSPSAIHAASATNPAVRVGMDGRHLRASARRGVSRYSRLLLDELARAYPDDEWVAVAPGVSELPPGVELRTGRLPRRPLFAAAAVSSRPRLDRVAGGCDVAWIPAPAPVAVSPGLPLVVTVHDLSFE